MASSGIDTDEENKSRGAFDERFSSSKLMRASIIYNKERKDQE